MTEMISMSRQEKEKLEERVRKSAADKAYLQLLMSLIQKMGAVPGVENVAGNMLRSIAEVIGGTNILLYFWIDDELFRMDVYGRNESLNALDDPLVQQVFESRQPLELEQDFAESQMTTVEFGKSYTWVYPLMVQPDLVGILKIENLNLCMRDLYQHLPVFFNYAALVLKNEIHSQTRLQKANEALSLEVAARTRAEAALSQSNLELERKVAERTDALRETNAQLLVYIAERARAEEALQVNEENLRSWFNAIHESVLLMNRDGVVLAANEVAAARMGRRVEECLGKSAFSLIPEDFAARRRVIVEEVLKSGQMRVFEDERNGRWLQHSICPVLNEHGIVERLAVFAMDITERREAELRLRESEEKYRTLSSNIPGMLYRARPDWTPQIISGSQVICGYSDDELLSGTPLWHQIIHPDDLPRILSESVKFSRESISLVQEYRITDKDGNIRWVSDHKSSILGKDGTFAGIDGIIFDITARRLSEDALHESRAKLAAALASMSDAVFISDTQGRFVDINDAFVHFHRFHRREECPKTLTEYQEMLEIFQTDGAPEAPEQRRVFRALQGEIGTNEERIIRRRDTGETWFGSYSFGPIRDANGTIAGVVVAARDISGRKRAENIQLQQHNLALALSRTMDVQDSLRLCLSAAMRISEMECGGIYLADPDTGHLSLVCHEGLSEAFVGMMREFGPDASNALLVSRGLPVFCHFDDVEGVLKYPEEQLRALAVLPILHEGKPIACLNLASRVQDDVSDPTRAALEAIAVQVGGFLARALLYEQLKRSEERFRILFEKHSAVELLIDPETAVIVDANQAAVEFYGYSLQELRSMPVARLNTLPPEEMMGEMRKVASRQQNRFSFQHRLADGSVRAVDVYSSPFEINGRTLFQSIVQDVTERRQAEQALELERTKLRSILETLPDGVYIADSAYRIEYVNPVIERDFGPLRGRRCFEYFNGRTEPCPWCKDTEVFVGKTVQWEWHHEQSGKTYELFGTPLLNPDGSTSKLELFHDITGRKQAETERERLREQLTQSQKMEAVGRLAGGVAHDFNNLLQVIQGYSESVQGDLEQDSQIREDIGEVIGAAERASALTRQLLAFSRRQVIEPVHTDINELIEGVLKMLRRVIGEHIEVRFHPAQRLGGVFVDQGQVEQVLMNLCVNARDAMPQGGKLSISTAPVTMDAAYCRKNPWAVEGAYVLVTVADTGHGMDAATCERIFEPFFTTKELGKGTGLGLATVYGIVKQHNGLIHVQSTVGVGSAFKIYLPVAARDARETLPEAAAPVAGGTETILVAEDEPSVLSLTAKILSSAGYTVLTAGDGKAALEVFREHADVIELLVLDVMMPGLSGKAVMDQILSTRSDKAFLFCSGYSESAIHKDFVIEEGLRLIQKPYRKEQLLLEVREILDRRSTAGIAFMPGGPGRRVS